MKLWIKRVLIFIGTLIAVPAIIGAAMVVGFLAPILGVGMIVVCIAICMAANVSNNSSKN